MRKQIYFIAFLISFPIFTCFAIETQFFCAPNTIKYDLKQDNLNLNSDFDARDHINLNSDDKEELTGKGITVAILDTGIYAEHSVFTDNQTQDWDERIKAFYDEDEKDEIDDPYDVSWHGTWAASILGGNSSTYQGVAPEVDMVIMKIFEYDDGDLSSDVQKVKDAVEWIIDNRKKYDIQIVSMSFGAAYEDNPEETTELNNIVELLVEENILVVVAAGNEGDDSDTNNIGTVSSPGSAKSVLTVGGIDDDGDMYSKSGTGPTFQDVIKPDVCALAEDVKGAKYGPPNNEFDTHTGTSASTPFVAGLAALLLEKDDDLDALELKSIISLTSLKTIETSSAKDNIQGWGAVQGYAAIDALKDPLEIKENTELEFSLSDEKGVFCKPIHLKGLTHYFFELIQEDSAEAEIYLFDSEPDEYGNPMLIASSLEIIPSPFHFNRIGVFPEKAHTYYLVAKLVYDSKDGDFKIKLIFEERVSIIIAFAGINTFALVYICKQFVSFKKLR